MTLWMAVGAAFWLGILTSISPCPLATNIAAISFLGSNVGTSKRLLLPGLFYALGRTLAYVLLSALLLGGMLASDSLSRFLQRYLNIILGPLLILVGMALLEMLGGTMSLNLVGSRVQQHASKGGPLWTIALGFLFAISFCPASAGLFFGAFLPIAAKQSSPVLLPVLYGIGTALPVLVFSVLIALGGQYVGRVFDRLTQIERWLRKATGLVFLIVGFYISLTFVYGMPSLKW